jgi:preprotein translocase subunit SecG
VDYKNGSSALLTVFLMIIIVAIAAVGVIIMTATSSEDISNVSNSSLEGLNYNSGIYNATNSTMHGLAGIMPNLVWLMLIFFFVVFLTILALGLRRG